MQSKFAWIIWCTFLTYSIFLSPRNDRNTRSTSNYVKQLMFEPWNGIDAYVTALFYSLGIWPLIYTSILLTDGQNQRLNGTLTSCLAMALGGFVILPYIALRRSERAKKFQSNILVRIFELKLVSVILMFSTIGLIIFALKFGDTDTFIHEFRTNNFINVMTIDFFIVSFSFPWLINDDLQRRNMIPTSRFQHYFILSFFPLFGPLLYLYKRRPLTTKQQQ